MVTAQISTREVRNQLLQNEKAGVWGFGFKDVARFFAGSRLPIIDTRRSSLTRNAETGRKNKECGTSGEIPESGTI
jgi:hypothetical protein